MTNQNQIYKCEICGNIVEMVHAGEGELVCCGQPMTLLKEKNEEELKEKHIPIVRESKEGVEVLIGEVPHPMEEKHFIEWVEVFTEKRNSKKFLKPTDNPHALFPTKAKVLKARVYCNIHGLWTTKE